tara:strand:+ start:1412 stop:2581 length:1170 start_codon:yes stop_codon:yes gene_type:complete
MKQIIQYTIITLSSFIISLFLFEIFLNFKNNKVDYNEIKQIYKQSTGKDYDDRNKIQVYKELVKKDKNLVVNVYPSLHIESKKNKDLFLPLSGISNSKTLDCNENGYFTIFKSDRYGFNNPDIEWDSNKIEYLLVGDSFTHGACVNRPNDIGSVLRNLSNKTVINIGYGGNGPLIEYATLKEYMPQNVKNIIWIYVENNDLINLGVEINNNILIKYLDDDTFTQDLINKQVKIDKFNRNVMMSHFLDDEIRILKKDSKLKYKILKFIRLDKTKNKLKSIIFSKKKNNEVNYNKFKQILNKANNLAKINNSKLYFVYLPSIERFRNLKYNDDLETIEQIVNGLGIKFININKEVFEKEDDKLSFFPFKTRQHYTVKGYDKVAETIYRLTR